MDSTKNGSTSNSVLVDAQGGVTVIPAKADLTRLNYFDGRFLRADDLQAEQDYLRTLVRLSNRAGGAGIVDGFDVALSEDQGSIVVKPGLALDGDGHALLLPVPQTLDVGMLIDAGQKDAAPAAVAGISDFAACASASPVETAATNVPGLYLLMVGFAEAACGQESVYGNLCADPCSGSTNARYLVEGVIFRAVPLKLALPDMKIIPLETKHLRSRVASAYFAPTAAGPLNLISGAGLRAATWCMGAAAAAGGDVPLAVFQRSGASIQFLDAWTARRERMDVPPRRYWAARMAMRPWDVFLAQVLQFQCQLHDLLGGGGPAPSADPCAAERGLLSDVATLIARLGDYSAELARISGVSFVASQLTAMKAKLDTAVATPPLAPDAGLGLLIGGGILELPSAGYLPVSSTGGETANAQVRRLVGPGLDLRFCTVRPDFVAHALEERQHMDRIPLLDGIADPNHKPEVDILVPNGTVVQTREAIQGREFVVQAGSRSGQPAGAASSRNASSFAGAGRVRIAGNSLEVTVALISPDTDTRIAHSPLPPAQPGASVGGSVSLINRLFTPSARLHNIAPERGDAQPVAVSEDPEKDPPQINIVRHEAVFATATIDHDPFAIAGPSVTDVKVSFTHGRAEQMTEDFLAQGTFTVKEPPRPGAAGSTEVRGTLDLVFGSTKRTLSPSGGSDNPAVNGGPIRLQVTLIRKPGLGNGDFSISASFGFGSDTNTVVLSWNQQIRKASFSINQDAMATAAEQANVLETDNDNNERVIQALDLIVDTGLESADWREMAAAKLWPPPPSPTDGVDILAGLDWVLFCRRRACTCDIDTPPVPIRSFQVWAVDIGDSSWDNEEIRKLVMSGSSRFTFKKVDVIDFLATGYQISNAARAPGRWKDATPDTIYEIKWGGIAMKGATDADWLEKNRLIAYEDAIAPAITAEQGASLREVLTQVPPHLSVPGTDGVILLAIAQPQVDVYRLRASKEGVEFLIKSGPFFNDDGSPEAARLGAVLLHRPKGQTDDEVRSAWNDFHDGEPYQAVVIYDASASIDESALAARAKDLTDELKGTISDVTFRAIKPWPSSRRSSLIVLVPYVRMIVYDGWSDSRKPNLKADINNSTRLGSVRFRLDSNQIQLPSDLGNATYTDWFSSPVCYFSSKADSDAGEPYQQFRTDARQMSIIHKLKARDPSSKITPVPLDDPAFDEAPYIIFLGLQEPVQ